MTLMKGMVVIPDSIGNPEKFRTGFPLEFTPCFDTGRE
jgi:hypothetical protein